MNSRVQAVSLLRQDFNLIKQALMPVPPFPEEQPQGPPPGAPPQGAPQGPPPPEAMPQQGPPPGADPSQSAAPPAISGEVATVIEQVVQKLESQGKEFAQYRQEQEARMQKLESELTQQKAIRDERKKVINTLLPAM